MGRPRSLAAAKACSWVAERRRLEAAKPLDVAEVGTGGSMGHSGVVGKTERDVRYCTT